MAAAVRRRVEVPATSCGWLAPVHRFRGTVVAVHPRSVYAAPAGPGPLLLVHDARHGPTPTSVQVDVGAIGTWPAAPGDAVSARAGHLGLGGLVVDLRQATVWEPGPPVLPVRAPWPRRWPGPPPDAALATACATVVQALVSQADDALLGALLPLVGRGPGLTPAGDDALVGMLAALHRALPAALGRRAAGRLAAALPPLLHRTSPVSAHYLDLALAGHFGQPLVDVVDGAARHGAPSAERVRRLCATGATSGADALTGIVTTLAVLGAARWPEVA